MLCIPKLPTRCIRLLILGVINQYINKLIAYKL